MLHEEVEPVESKDLVENEIYLDHTQEYAVVLRFIKRDKRRVIFKCILGQHGYNETDGLIHFSVAFNHTFYKFK